MEKFKSVIHENGSETSGKKRKLIFMNNAFNLKNILISKFFKNKELFSDSSVIQKALLHIFARDYIFLYYETSIILLQRNFHIGVLNFQICCNLYIHDTLSKFIL